MVVEVMEFESAKPGGAETSDQVNGPVPVALIAVSG